MMKNTLLALLVALPTWLSAQSYEDAKNIVAIGGPVTEIIFALGAGDRVVARDTTSVYPNEVHSLPDVGYMRRLSAESVLSVAPDLIVTRDTAGPPEALDQLRAASVPMVEVHDGFSPDSTVNAILTIGEALGKTDEASALAYDVEAKFAALMNDTANGPKPRAMFILSTRGGRLNVAGRGTGAHGVIKLAGAVNVMGEAFEGYKPASEEAIIQAAPDVIVMMSSGNGHTAKADEILSMPAISQTPAGEMGAFALVNSAALGFGPRTPGLVSELRAKILAEITQ